MMALNCASSLRPMATTDHLKALYPSAGTLSQYQEMEQTVYNSLFTLIKDTSVLRDYAAAAILIIQVCVVRTSMCRYNMQVVCLDTAL
jgi:hypothetical protein